MPKIFPFRALHYDSARVGDLSQVIGQPYDKVDERLRKHYYDRHPHHVVRLDKRRDEPGDATGDRKYAAAAKDVQAWLQEGVLVEDDPPGLYAVRQTYRIAEGRRVRKGLCAMMRLEEFGRGKIYPHEETHTGPKIDRLKLLRATGVHFGHIFMLYSDPAGDVNRILDAEAAKRAPDLSAVDEEGGEHRVWRLTDPATLRSLCDVMDPKDAIIADGHHRYETALAFHKECAAGGRRSAGAESHENVLVTLVSLEDRGLTCLGTHRVIHDRPAVQPEGLLGALQEMFEVTRYSFSSAEEERRARASLLDDLRAGDRRRPAFGLALPQGLHALLRVRDLRATAARVQVPRSEEWRSLDVNILHAVVLEGMLGITAEDTAAERYVAYVRSADEAVDAVVAGRAVAAFLVNPVQMAQIQTIVTKGERFPQKTTDFYPKMLSGLLMARLRFIA
ncbi:MAG: DUF1015 domain-containing protein [Planctomycetes bacterium]|nr:DUF1015 domain-containing protein [Planctomycetota bacterium]